jgi:uncharacterized protein YndB with AHSA1/START domain
MEVISMETEKNISITVETKVEASLDKVWECWTEPVHIVNWNNASDDWFTPHAENDLRTGGSFVSRMEARDGSTGFDFGGKYDEVIPKSLIAYTMEDGRKVRITFKEEDGGVKIVETFDAEHTFPPEYQKAGWQSIMDNFRKYVETNYGNS